MAKKARIVTSSVCILRAVKDDGRLATGTAVDFRVVATGLLRRQLSVGMAVDAPWRGRGVGSQLLAAAIDWGRGRGAHKVSLKVFPHNFAALALYEKFGFVREGLRLQHYHRENGELWDSIMMGLAQI